jgi:hypothetical protein
VREGNRIKPLLSAAAARVREGATGFARLAIMLLFFGTLGQTCPCRDSERDEEEVIIT